MRDQLERFHVALAFQSAGIGLVVATASVMATRLRGRPWRPAGRPVLVAVISTMITLGLWGYLDAAGAVALTAVTTLALADSRPDTPIAGVMAVISLAGVWGAVPDTEAPLVAAAIVTVVVLVGTTVARVTVPGRWRRSDRLAAVVLVVVVAIIGSAGRSEVVGGIGCVGLLVTAVLPTPRSPPRYDIRSSASVGLHLVLVASSSRLLTRCSMPVAIAGVVTIVGAALFTGSLIGGGASQVEDPTA